MYCWLPWCCPGLVYKCVRIMRKSLRTHTLLIYCKSQSHQITSKISQFRISLSIACQLHGSSGDTGHCQYQYCTPGLTHPISHAMSDMTCCARTVYGCAMDNISTDLTAVNQDVTATTVLRIMNQIITVHVSYMLVFTI